MTTDRYTKAVWTAIAVALAAIALNLWFTAGPGLQLLGARPAEAQGSGPQFEVVIPKSWGKIIGYSPGNLLLEAPDGSLREADLRGPGPEYPKVKFLARWK